MRVDVGMREGMRVEVGMSVKAEVKSGVRVKVRVGVGVRYLGLRDIAIGESSVCSSDIAGNT